ncbi:MAG: hypothetical protein HY561_12065 [Gemmatimonadetes bacterium]|nr:hypothetical protein [Gemmatimonadota bacterium]
MKPVGFLIIAGLLATVSPASAQRLESRFPAQPEAPAERIGGPSAWRPLRVTKWSTLALSAASAGYGFITNHRADQRFQRIEELCRQESDRCEQGPGGAYLDPDLEAQYQEVVRLDDRARIALVASQIGVAASVILFILDMREESTPPNIPYEPKLELGRNSDGALLLGARLPLSP